MKIPNRGKPRYDRYEWRLSDGRRYCRLPDRRFDGTFGAYNGSAYEITGIYGVEGDDENDREGMMAQGGHYFPGPGVFVPPWDLSPIAKQTYDAYSYDGGTYYSNGVSYYETYFQ